jgi:hypothetical protein
VAIVTFLQIVEHLYEGPPVENGMMHCQREDGWLTATRMTQFPAGERAPQCHSLSIILGEGAGAQGFGFDDYLKQLTVLELHNARS